MRTLAIDIETAPHTVYVWGMWKQHVNLDQVVETGRVMCFAAQWVGEESEPAFWSEKHHGHRRMIGEARNLLDSADAVIHYNGTKFDIPMLNREFVKYRLHPPAPYHEIDLLKTVRRKFKFGRNSLDSVLRELELGQKVKHRGFGLWVDCMGGDEAAWEEMKKYNLADVTEMVKLYDRLLPWLNSHPNVALYNGTAAPTCPKCGSEAVHRRGYAYTKTQRYQRYCCQDCGSWSRGRQSDVSPVERQDILSSL